MEWRAGAGATVGAGPEVEQVTEAEQEAVAVVGGLAGALVVPDLAREMHGVA